MSNFNYNYGSQFIDKKDIDAVVNVLKSNYLTKGPKVIEFENKFKKKVKAKFAVSCSSGTAALHLVYKSLGIKSGDIVISPTITFSGTINPAKLLGARIIFADCEKTTGLISKNSVKIIIDKLKENKKIHNLKVLCLVNLNGQSSDMIYFKRLSKLYNFKIIEDACHSLGSYYRNKSPIGSCKYSDFSTFSFHPVKAITTGEGGMITLNKKEYFLNILKFRNHGFDYPKSKIKRKPWLYEINNIFLNYRLSDINAALGLSQLSKLDNFIKRRQLLARKYNFYFEKIGNKNIKTLENLNFSTNSYHLFVILVDFSKIKIDKSTLVYKLKKVGINTQVHYIPIHKEKLYNDNVLKLDYSNSIKYYNCALSLPIYYKLKIKDISYIVNQINDLIA